MQHENQSRDFVQGTATEILTELINILIFNKTAVANGFRRIVAMVWGDTSTAKSSIGHEAFNLSGYNTPWDFRANLYEPPDLIGFPLVINKDSDYPKSIHAPLARLPEKGDPGNGKPDGMIIDELPNAEKDMQSALYQLVYDFMVGNVVLPDDYSIICFGNRAQDHAGINEMPQPLKERMRHYEIVISIDSWAVWATKNKINPIIIAFLRMFPQYLHNIDHEQYISPTPRMWEMLSNSLTLPTPNRLLTVQSCVGLGAARAYLTFEKEAAHMPDIDELLTNPTQVNIPDGSILYAICTALAVHANKNNFSQVLKFLDRLQPEYATFVVRDAIQSKPYLADSVEFSGPGGWAERNAEIMLG